MKRFQTGKFPPKRMKIGMACVQTSANACQSRRTAIGAISSDEFKRLLNCDTDTILPYRGNEARDEGRTQKSE